MRLESFTSLGATLLLITATACTGSFEPGTGPGGDGDGEDTVDAGGETAVGARAAYDALHEQLMLECATCHVGINDAASAANGPDFYGSTRDADSTYAAVTTAVSTITGSPLIAGSPTDSRLFFYGGSAHATSIGASDALRPQIESWLTLYAAENATDEPEPEPTGPQSITEAFEMFASCMSYDDFTAQNFPAIAEITTEDGQCVRCHSVGEGNAYLSDDPIDFYIGQRSLDGNGTLASTSILAFVNASLVGGEYQFTQTKRYQKKGTGIGVVVHPNYIFADADNGDSLVPAVDAFFEATLARYEESLATGVPCVPDNPIDENN